MIHEGSIQLPFRYAAGDAGSRFLTALRDEGRLVGSRCTGCSRVVCPAQPFCSRCGEGAMEWVDVGSTGTLVSWTELADGHAYGLVRLDGADGAMLHRLLGDPSGRSVGARFRVRLASDRAGSILDIDGFEPAEGCG